MQWKWFPATSIRYWGMPWGGESIGMAMVWGGKSEGVRMRWIQWGWVNGRECERETARESNACKDDGVALLHPSLYTCWGVSGSSDVVYESAHILRVSVSWIYEPVSPMSVNGWLLELDTADDEDNGEKAGWQSILNLEAPQLHRVWNLV